MQPPISIFRAAAWLVAVLWATAQGVAMAQQKPPVASASHKPRHESLKLDDNLLVLEVRLDGFVLSGSLGAYQDGVQFLLPLGELAKLLTLDISVNPGAGSATGNVLSQDRAFSLNVANSRVNANGREATFEPRQVRVIDNDIYVSSELLSRWLPIDLEVSLPTMRLRVTPREPLPLQARLEREREAAHLIGPQARVLDAGYPFVPMPYQLISTPFIDQSIGTDVRVGNGIRQTRASYTAYLTADVLGMEGAAYVSTSNGRLATDWRWTLGRNDPDAGLLGPLRARSFQIGNISMPSLRNITSASPKGYGATVSNRRLDQPANFDRETLRGDLPPGWDVTLYYNDALIGYQPSRADGLYAFEDLPLSFGRNEFALVFNGPLGQRRTQRRNYLLDQLTVQPGELLYSLGQLHAQSGASLTTAGFELGLTKTMAANASLARVPLSRTGETVGYGVVGLRGYLDWAIVTAELALAQRGGALVEVGLKTAYANYALDLLHTQAQGNYESDLFPAAGIRRRSLMRLQGTLVASGLPRMPITLVAQRQVFASGATNDSASGRLSLTLDGNSITNGLSWQRVDGATMTSGTLQIDRRMANTSFSGQLAYLLRPHARVESLAITANRQLGRNFTLNTGLLHTLSSHQTLLTAGLSKQFDAFMLTFSGSYSSDKEFAFGLMASMGLGRDPRSGKWKFDALSMAGTGAVSARAFVDRNMNGVYDAGEEPVPNAGFAINSGGRSPNNTDETGMAFINRMTVKQYTDIALDPGTLEDPLWMSMKPGVRILARPGGVQSVDFPVVSGSEVDGTVILLENDLRRGIGDALVELVDELGNVVASTRSSSDGFYLLTQVLPGQFTLRISPEQMASLKLGGGKERQLTVPADGDFISGQDFELQVPGL